MYVCTSSAHGAEQCIIVVWSNNRSSPCLPCAQSDNKFLLWKNRPYYFTCIPECYLQCSYYTNLHCRQLLESTCRIANVLKREGVKKGDRVAVYMPASPLQAATMLACARIGAIHR